MKFFADVGISMSTVRALREWGKSLYDFRRDFTPVSLMASARGFAV